jgi:hypothetical protein
MDNGSCENLGSIDQPQITAETPIPLPVTCPICGTESVTAFPALVVLTALTRWNNMALYASCHEGSWNASPAEIERIRAFLGEPWIDAHRYLVTPEA